MRKGNAVKHKRPKQLRKAGKASPKNPLWLRPALWLGGVATAVVSGVLVNVLTPQAQRIAPSPSPALAAPISSSPSTSSVGRNRVARQRRKTTEVALGPPLKVLSEDPLNLDQTVDWAFPEEYLPDHDQIDEISSLIQSLAPTSRSALVHWFFAQGAFEIGGASTQIVVQNDRDYPVRIIDINVVKSCGHPLGGTLFSGSGGAVDRTVGLGFNLDSTDTDAELAQGMGQSYWKPDYFARDTISLLPRGEQVFDIYTVTSSHACTYRLRATVLDGSRKVYELIGDGNQPFRVTAMLEGDNAPPFGYYKAMYLGGVGTRNGAFKRVNPRKAFG